MNTLIQKIHNPYDESGARISYHHIMKRDYMKYFHDAKGKNSEASIFANMERSKEFMSLDTPLFICH